MDILTKIFGGSDLVKEVGKIADDLITSKEEKINEEVNQRALQAFYVHNLHHTKDRTAILIMVSLLERRVEILADAGINEKVSKDTWQCIVNDMIACIKTNDLSEGMCVAVRECGDILAKNFPGHHDNPNEVCNKLIVED